VWDGAAVRTVSDGVALAGRGEGERISRSSKAKKAARIMYRHCKWQGTSTHDCLLDRMVLAKVTGLGLPRADQNRRTAQVTTWYADDRMSPCRRNSLVVVQCVHKRTSGPNLSSHSVRRLASQT
jgi:hypothetical protein